MDWAVDPTSLILLHLKLIYSGFSFWRTILTDKSSFTNLCWWVHKTNLVYRTPSIAHFVVLFRQHVTLFESRHKHKYLPKWHHKILHRTWTPKNQFLQTLCNCSVSMFGKRIFARERKPKLRIMLSDEHCKLHYLFVFYLHSLECHKYIRIILLWVKLKLQSDQHVCSYESGFEVACKHSTRHVPSTGLMLLGLTSRRNLLWESCSQIEILETATVKERDGFLLRKDHSCWPWAGSPFQTTHSQWPFRPSWLMILMMALKWKSHRKSHTCSQETKAKCQEYHNLK